MEKGYLGIGWKFPPTFETRDAACEMVADKDDIKESLNILFATKPGERIIAPEFGINFRPFVFEIMDAGFYNNLREVIYQSILDFEKRITPENIEIVSNEDYYGQYVEIKIDYRINKTGEYDDTVINIKLE